VPENVRSRDDREADTEQQDANFDLVVLAIGDYRGDVDLADPVLSQLLVRDVRKATPILLKSELCDIAKICDGGWRLPDAFEPI
jgi:hypothetical protein